MSLSFSDYKIKAHSTKSNRMEVDLIYKAERTLSIRISYFLIKIIPNILPTWVSMINVLLLLIILMLNFIAVFFETNYPILIIIQFFVLRLAILGDKVDGEVARYKEYFTQQGIFFDIIFHFLYPFVLFFTVGLYFYIQSGNVVTLLLSICVGFLMTIYKMLGKIRHHIKYKIKLESHELLIKDLAVKSGLRTRSAIFYRLTDYLSFFIYDWVWCLYLVLIIGSFYFSELFFVAYNLHLVWLSVVLLVKIFFVYPNNNLFTRQDLIG